MVYIERVAVLSGGKDTHVMVDDWSLKGYRANIVMLRWQTYGQLQENEASRVMEPLGCLPQNKSLSREKSCLTKAHVCRGMKEVVML